MPHFQVSLVWEAICFTIFENQKRDLEDELFSCHKFIGISMDQLQKMPVFKRKYWIQKHNEHVKKEKEEHDRAASKPKQGRRK
jgi:hypothetical protein